MVSKNDKNWKSSSKLNLDSGFPRVLRNSDRAPAGVVYSGASPRKSGDGVRAFFGFASLVILFAVILFLAVRVAESAGIVAWRVGVLDALTLSLLYSLWRSIDSFVFGSVRNAGTKK